MLLPVLRGPETTFRQVHEKSSCNSGKISANFQPQILQANFSNFFFSGPFKALRPEFRTPGNTGCCPATHPPHFPLPLPPLPLTPHIPSRARSYRQMLHLHAKLSTQ